MKARFTTKTYINCPNCGYNYLGTVDHLIENLEKPAWKTASGEGRYPTFGPWGCEECGAQITGIVRAADDVELKIEPGTNVRVWDVLVLEPQKHPVYFIVDAKDYGRRPGEPKDDNKSYFYDEHTCPTNWIRNVECIAIESDTDPHGLFTFVESIDQDAVQKTLYDGQNPDDATYMLWDKILPHLIK